MARTPRNSQRASGNSRSISEPVIQPVHRQAEGRPHTGSYGDAPDNAARCRLGAGEPGGSFQTLSKASVIIGTVAALVAGTMTVLWGAQAQARGFRPAEASPETARYPQGGSSDSSIPASLRPPAGNKEFAVADGRGVQIYPCTNGTWGTATPAAILSGGTSAIHYAGPTWQSTRDGSKVQAKAIASEPNPNSIPLLLLQATDTQGTGAFSAVTYIQRLKTQGGAAPQGSCQDGEIKAVPYTAKYRFFTPR